ncbi:MAG: P-loop ATPase, Sll1717 family, partial [Fimbriimonadales bacterium]
VLQKEPQKIYYIVIDRLDEQWIEDSIRYKLLRTLIDTMAFLNKKITGLKIVAGFRLDLLTRVYELSKEGGFQREKYKDLELNLAWDHTWLEELMDKRVNKLVRSTYSVSEPVSAASILPDLIDKRPAIDYMLDRTLLRPRDIIDFFNTSIALAKGSPMLTAEVVKEAEGTYSKSRLASLADEWRSDYAHLEIALSELLRGRFRSFHLRDIDDSLIEEFCLRYAVREESPAKDVILDLSRSVAELKMGFSEFRARIASIFYRVTAIGLKPEGYEAMAWSHTDLTAMHYRYLDDDVPAAIHPSLWRALSVRG